MRIVHLEDDPADAELVREALVESGLAAEIACVDNREDFLAALLEAPPDLILSDYNLPSFDGATALILAREKYPEVPFIFISGTIGEDRAVEVLRNGATDYVLKTRLDKLPLALRRALEIPEERQRAREAEQRLRVSEQRFRRLVEELPGYFFTAHLDPMGGKLTYVSPQVEQIFGYAAAEWLAQPRLWREHIHPDDLPKVMECIERCVAEGTPVVFDHRILHRDGRVRWVRAALKTESRGSPEIRGIVTDITELHLVGEQFLQAQKMEVVGRLAGGIAHDFNNLLTVINGYSELVLAGLPPGDPTRADLEEVHNAGKRAANLTRQLLTFSRKQVTRTMTVDLNELITGVRKMLDRLVGEDVKITFTPGEGPLSIIADPGQIEQVLLNLVVNARDAMPHGGKITLETSEAVLSEAAARTHHDARPGPYVLLSVTDAGTGMSDEVKAHLFEPFFTTKDKGKGTGLGLSTVHGIVKNAGGAIDVQSAPGRGTTFRIHFPRAGKAAESAVTKGVPDRMSRGSETVLVAEDQETVRRLARVVLEGAGYTVLSAMDGTEALRMAESHEGPIHLLLTDMVMRSMSGAELARILNREHPETRVLFMSGYAERGLQEVGEDAAFLQKPFTLEGLKAKVRDVLDSVEKGRA